MCVCIYIYIYIYIYSDSAAFSISKDDMHLISATSETSS